jgi:hypothetical protein
MGRTIADYIVDYIADYTLRHCLLSQAGNAAFQGFLAGRKWRIGPKNWRRGRDSQSLSGILVSVLEVSLAAAT